MKRPRWWPSPATLVALIALFVALGGTSYAALSIPKNSVGTAQLRNGAVTKAKIATKTLTGLKGKQGATGAPGAAGAPGATGATGPIGATGPAGNPATADGAAVVMGRVVYPGSGNCLIGAPNGANSSASCDQAGLTQQSEVVPTAKVIRSAEASIPASIANTLRFYLITPSFNILGTCDIPSGQTTCTIAGPLSVSAGTLLSIEVDHIGGTTLPSSVGYGFELWSPTAAPVAPAHVTGAQPASKGS